jgi:alpha-L-fucosidase
VPVSVKGTEYENGFGLNWATWAYNAASPADSYLTAAELVAYIVPTIAAGSNVALGFGPDGSGRISERYMAPLREMGAWLTPHGKCIYDTSKWTNISEKVVAGAGFEPAHHDTSNVFGAVPAPGETTADVVFLGNTTSWQACESCCKRRADCVSYTWTPPTEVGA